MPPPSPNTHLLRNEHSLSTIPLCVYLLQEAPAASPDECVLVEVHESQCVSEVETIYQQLSSTDAFPLMDDTHIEEVSVLTSSPDETESQEPTVYTNHASPLWSPSFCELGPELSTTDSLHNIAHDHDYGGSLGKETSTVETVDVSKKVTVQRQGPSLNPNLELPTSSIEHLKDLLDTRDIPSIVTAFINMPSLKSELVKQLVKLY